MRIAQGELGQTGGEGAEGGGRLRRHTRSRISSRRNPWRILLPPAVLPPAADPEPAARSA
ncbi:hypothetical protein STVIR_4620 [Streptomyces viridochromogenes Tue57]|uniref:Uncharacterized protein n=1 Tax=Streptomyces viridochromogenes Tue57 TaxID=1160705 RepID=L8PA25_STRVR|nr:hypothetical protein STVIR_4620 [Streptomyces viridochromogenes Tue57]